MNNQIFISLYQEAIQELQIQIDKFEADIETLSASLKKKKSDKDVSLFQVNKDDIRFDLP